MLGANVREVGWPACGEVDIMEVFGHRRGHQTCSTVHNLEHSWGTKDPLEGGCAALEAATLSDWHVWTLEWSPERIAFFFDDKIEPIFAYQPSQGSAATDGEDDGQNTATEQYPYRHPFYLIANLAVGGNGPSEAVDEEALDGEGTSLSIDYVRVYALKEEGAAKEGAAKESTSAKRIAAGTPPSNHGAATQLDVMHPDQSGDRPSPSSIPLANSSVAIGRYWQEALGASIIGLLCLLVASRRFAHRARDRRGQDSRPLHRGELAQRLLTSQNADITDMP